MDIPMKRSKLYNYMYILQHKYTEKLSKNLSVLLKILNVYHVWVWRSGRVQGSRSNGWWFKSHMQHLFLSMHPYNIRGKYTSYLGMCKWRFLDTQNYGKIHMCLRNVYVKIPRCSKCGKIFHPSMGICVGKFLEVQNICESLVWYMENA